MDTTGLDAAELHEQLGQTLTALRANSAFLLRLTADRSDLHAAARDVEIQGAEIGDGLRALRRELDPLQEHAGALQPLLHDIVKSWQDASGLSGDYRLEVSPADLVLPRDLSHSLCHMTHDALKLFARKSVAGPVRVSVRVADDDPAVLFWEVGGVGPGFAARLPLDMEGRR